MQQIFRPCSLRSQCPFRGVAGPIKHISTSCKAGPESAFGEDVLVRLKAAEEEAARLRKELVAAQATKVCSQVRRYLMLV